MDLAVRTAKQAAGASREAFARALRAALQSHQTLLNGGQPMVDRERVSGQFVVEALNADGDIAKALCRLETVDRRLRAAFAGIARLFIDTTEP